MKKKHLIPLGLLIVFSLSQGLSYFKVCIPHAIKRTARAVANGYFIKIFVLIALN
ncbi:hypothetical protein EC840_102546 [Rahnella sp. JUb53]|jgi:hypothetical protein|nr:hypothetical protein EC840_102546 [Rahnella sp. JUb53]